ncbi:MAG: hypothetical protein QGH69_05025 [Alphaproteobacteria bacterium]|jgi:methyl-accepting chemotaxis protein|nr:hypothetical protein [Alphaproteobacteria bacterium]
MNFREEDIKRNYELVFGTLKEYRVQIKEQTARVRDLCAEIDRLDDVGQSNHRHIDTLTEATKELDRLKESYQRHLKYFRCWQKRLALFQQFKSDYATAGLGGES